MQSKVVKPTYKMYHNYTVSGLFVLQEWLWLQRQVK